METIKEVIHPMYKAKEMFQTHLAKFLRRASREILFKKP